MSSVNNDDFKLGPVEYVVGVGVLGVVKLYAAISLCAKLIASPFQSKPRELSDLDIDIVKSNVENESVEKIDKVSKSLFTRLKEKLSRSKNQKYDSILNLTTEDKKEIKTETKAKIKKEAKTAKEAQKLAEKDFDRFVKGLNFKSFDTSDIKATNTKGKTTRYQIAAEVIVKDLKEFMKDSKLDRDLELHILGKIIDRYHKVEDGKVIYFILQKYVTEKCKKSLEFHTALYENLDPEHSPESRVRQAVESVTTDIKKPLLDRISSKQAQLEVALILADFAVYSSKKDDNANVSDITDLKKSKQHPARFAMDTLEDVITQKELLMKDFQDVMKLVNEAQEKALALKAAKETVDKANQELTIMHADLDPKIKKAKLLQEQFGQLQAIDNYLKIYEGAKVQAKKECDLAKNTLDVYSKQKRYVDHVYSALFGADIVGFLAVRGQSHSKQFKDCFDAEGKVKSSHSHDFMRNAQSFIKDFKKLTDDDFDVLVTLDPSKSKVQHDELKNLKNFRDQLPTKVTLSNIQDITKIIHSIFVKDEDKALSQQVKARKRTLDETVKDAGEKFKEAKRSLEAKSKDVINKQKEINLAKAKLKEAQLDFMQSNEIDQSYNTNKTPEESRNHQITTFFDEKTKKLNKKKDEVNQVVEKWYGATRDVEKANESIVGALNEAKGIDKTTPTYFLASAIGRRADEIFQDAQLWCAIEKQTTNTQPQHQYDNISQYYESNEYKSIFMEVDINSSNNNNNNINNDNNNDNNIIIDQKDEIGLNDLANADDNYDE